MNDLVADWRGDVTLRFAGTRVFSLETLDRGSTIEGAGAMSTDTRSAPKFRFLASAGYQEGPFTGTLMARGISSGKLDNLLIECSSGCPESTAAHPTIDRNHVDSSLTFDLALAYKFNVDASDIEAFLAVENLTDEDPPVIPGNRSAGYHVGQPVTAYPALGRILRVGVRMNL
jgi:outer membrane receptor protein involved in Fe transport